MALESECLIYVVEDDQSIAELISYNLTCEGYAVVHVVSGKHLFELLRSETREVALFVLDVMLPEMDGYEICRLLRDDARYRFSSFLFLTARAMEQDKLIAFASGADDYLTKPFGMREFLARVGALVKRQQQRLALNAGQADVPDLNKTKAKPFQTESVRADADVTESEEQNDDGGDRIILGALCLDDARHRVFCRDEEISLTYREYELLKFLMLNRGLVFSRDELLNHVWGYEFSGETRTVDVHIRQLRRKIEADPAEPHYIETVRGVGYRLIDNPTDPLSD